MDATSAQTSFLPFNGTLALGLLLAFVLWVFVKRLRIAETFLTQHRWGEVVVDCVLALSAVIGFGWFLDRLMVAFDVANAQAVARAVTEFLLYIAVAFCVARVLEVWIVTQRRANGDRTLTGLGRVLLFGICFLVALLFWWSNNDYGTTEALVSTGALAALLAFAMQQTLGDLFSGIAMSIEKPFRVGDWLRFNDGSEGEVTDINWRATRLRGWDNTTRIVPNGQLARESFTNLHGSTHQFSPWYVLRVSGEADPNEIVALLRDAALRCDTVLSDPAPVARLMDATTIPYTYMVWVHFPNYPSMFAGREELYREIHHALRARSLGIAAEIREVRHRPVDAQTATPPVRSVG